ncbi:uncharacterized protein A4U43_C07F31950 [Asparagus officinalis]|uniref:BHLH domain-containing protein n=1 Tax=Asparagus officinalis TaxID=4686 RepID=A0A5P1EGH5_ASPOF|nr:uncharacterized protein A4U43_C07F31950 [Asparagus officinalis]
MPPPKPQINDIQLASSLRNGEHVNFSHLLRHNLSNASKCVLGIGEKEGAPAISPQGVQENTYDAIATSSSGQPSTSNQNLRRKRKNGDEFECHSEEAEYESTEGNELNQLPASTRKSRAAEVHNLSERRRRDRINEKMRALQELIPHCNKVMWMGNGMATMMFPSVQQYMDRASILPMNKPIQLSRTPPLNQMNPINFPAQNMESYDQYYGFPQTQLSPQAMNLCSYGSHMLQQNQTVKVSGSNSLPTSGIHFENGHSGLKHGNSTW